MKRLLSFFVLVLLIMILFQTNGIEQKKQTYDSNVKRLRQEKVDLIFNEFLKIKVKEADKLSNITKRDIISDFDTNYKNNKHALEKEISDVVTGNYTGVSPALDMIGSNIEGKTLNGITGNAADNNDMIVWAKNIIVTDLSLNCATGSRIRSIQAEQKNHFSKLLALNAMNDITSRGRPFTLWHFLPVRKDLSWYNDVKNYSSTDIKDLMDLYLKYGADERILEGFEFLVSNRIYDNKDYFSNRVITPTGILQNDHLQIIITSGFNILDQLNAAPEYQLRLININNNIENERNTYYKYEKDHHIQIVVYGLLMMLLFVHVQLHLDKNNSDNNAEKKR